MDRARPPDDITPEEFFTRWVPDAVARDETRRAKLGETRAVIEFTLDGEGGGVYALHVEQGSVRGERGGAAHAALRVRVDVETWRMLNRGETSAPQALLRRKLHLAGDFLLGLKLHLILGP